MTIQIGRRSLLKATAGIAGLSAFGTAFGGLPTLARDQNRFRVYWWGTKERADRTLAAVSLYQQKNSGIRIDGESLSWADYWPRLATQAAGRNAPDLIQMDYRYVAEYARRNALAPLDEYLGSILDISDFDKESIDSCRVDGKLYGINLGNNSHSLIFNKAAYAKAGVPEPEPGMTWDQLIERATEITKAHDGNYFGVSDGSLEENAFENWLRQRGKALYTAEASWPSTRATPASGSTSGPRPARPRPARPPTSRPWTRTTSKPAC
jgi:multiple sugar transport system substrate-binding protein